MSRHVVIFLALALGASSAVGQVTGTGRSERDLGNLYVTGQVTGGFAFRGRSPYAGVNQLSLRLPSEMVDDFTRDSVGLDRLQGGRSYRPQAFTAPSRATYMLRTAIRRGQDDYSTMPGDRPSIVSLPAPSATAEVRPGAAFEPILNTRDLAAMINRAHPAVPTLAGDGTAISAVIPEGGERPGVSALFGMMQETQRKKLAEEMLQTEKLPVEVEPESSPAEDVEPAVREPEAGGGDVFADLLIELADLPDGSPIEPSTVRGPAPSASLERLDVDPAQRVAAGRSATTLAGQIGRGIVLRRLGGSGTDQFNRLMAQGDRFLAKGRFYRAAGRYENARIIMASNPLPAVGAGLAYLGAGESHRASYYLRLSLRILPELMKVRTDIDKLLGKGVVDRRLAELKEQIADDADPGNMPALFLMAFIHANRGQTEQARAWAGRLAPLVENDPRMRSYVRFLIGEPITTAPADQ